MREMKYYHYKQFDMEAHKDINVLRTSLINMGQDGIKRYKTSLFVSVLNYSTHDIIPADHVLIILLSESFNAVYII